MLLSITHLSVGSKSPVDGEKERGTQMRRVGNAGNTLSFDFLNFVEILPFLFYLFLIFFIFNSSVFLQFVV